MKTLSLQEMYGNLCVMFAKDENQLEVMIVKRTQELMKAKDDRLGCRATAIMEIFEKIRDPLLGSFDK